MDKYIENIKYDLIKFISLFHKLFTPAFKREIDDKYDCNKNQVRAIMIIGRVGKASPTVLGKCMDMEKGSITSLIDALEDEGLVYRKADLKDKRKTWIHLTEIGEEFYQKQDDNFMLQIQNVFKSLSDEELEELSKNLKTIVKVMEKVGDENEYTR